MELSESDGTLDTPHKKEHGTVAGGKGVKGGDAVAGGHDTGHVSPVTISCHYIVIKKKTFRSCHVSTWIVPELGWGGLFLVEQC